MLNDRLLTQRKGKIIIYDAFVSYDKHCTNILVIILFIGIIRFSFVSTSELSICTVNVYFDVFSSVCMKKKTLENGKYAINIGIYLSINVIY